MGDEGLGARDEGKEQRDKGKARSAVISHWALGFGHSPFVSLFLRHFAYSSQLDFRGAGFLIRLINLAD